MRETEIPAFGPLSGVKVVCYGTVIAGPFACSLMADWGADVIWVENPKAPDVARTTMLFEQDRRNGRSARIDPVKEKDTFIRVLTSGDIMVESSKGGQFSRWGITDDLLWEMNPALVIVHISGFGQSGDPDYIGRPAYDPIAQAFSGHVWFNGYPDRDPILAGNNAGDYYAAMMAVSSAMAALYRARQTGKGDSVDVAMYEAMLRLHGKYPAGYFNRGEEIGPECRPGTMNDRYAGFGRFTCRDGGLVYVCPLGVSPMKNTINFLKLGYGSEEYPAGISFIDNADTERAADFIRAISDFCSSHTAEEAESLMVAAGVPCQRVLTYAQAAENPHYKARETFTEWESGRGTVRGVNIVPKFARNPGKIWRGAPAMGEDTEDILRELGLTGEGNGACK